MIENLLNLLSEGLYINPMLALFSSFAWGILSILLSPCHLSSIPLIIGFISTQDEIHGKRSFGVALLFSFGILVTIAVIGIITAIMGKLIGDVGMVGNYIVATVFFIVGLYFFDLIDLSFLSFGLKKNRYRGFTAAFILGLVFGIGLGPCTFAFMAPVLGVVFEVSHSNLIYSILLLSFFALGHCIIIVIAGVLGGRIQKYLDWSGRSRSIKLIKRVCGILVMLGGIYFVYLTI